MDQYNRSRCSCLGAIISTILLVLGVMGVAIGLLYCTGLVMQLILASGTKDFSFNFAVNMFSSLLGIPFLFVLSIIILCIVKCACQINADCHCCDCNDCMKRYNQSRSNEVNLDA